MSVSLVDIEISDVVYVDGGDCFQGLVSFYFEESEADYGQSAKARVNVSAPNNMPYDKIELLLLEKAFEILKLDDTLAYQAFPAYKEERARRLKNPA